MNTGDRLEHEEDQLRSWLVEYDDALANGTSPAAGTSDHSVAPNDTTRQLAHLLDRMATVWPRQSWQNLDLQDACADKAPAQIGRFQIEREIGRGGFGIVFRAVDPPLGRIVAIKMPRLELLLSPSLRRRFVLEAQATAALDHPHILPLYEAGQDGSVCYIVSMYCPNGTLAEFLTSNELSLSIRQAVVLVYQLSNAAHYAHSQGILHRDIKPANVLLDFRQASSAFRESLPFIARLTDFGLAKIQADESDNVSQIHHDTHSTGTGVMIGTPRYMAPEQVEGQTRSICPATDVYGLGVLLYELLTGTPPFPGANKVETLRRVLTEDPLPPRRLRQEIPADLEAICLHCLNKAPAQRYISADALSEELQRFLQGIPTCVRPLSRIAKVARWAHQRPAITALSATLLAVVVSAILGLASYSWKLRNYADALQASSLRDQKNIQAIEQQRKRAIAGELEARQYALASDTIRAFRMWTEGQPERMREVLSRMRPTEGQVDIRGFAWRYLWALSGNIIDFSGSEAGKYGVRFSPDGQQFLAWSTLSTDNRVSIWHMPTRERILTIKLKDRPVAATFNQDGSAVITVDASQTVCTWKALTGEKIDETYLEDLPAHLPSTDDRLALSHDGDCLVYVPTRQSGKTLISEKLRIWNTQTRQVRTVLDSFPHSVYAVAISPDAKSIAVSAVDHGEWPNVLVIDAETGVTEHTLSHWGAHFHDITFSPNGRLLAGGSYLRKGFAVVWDLATSDSLYFEQEGTEPVVHVAFSPDGGLLATSGLQDSGEEPSEKIRLVDLSSRQVVAEPATLGQNIGQLAFCPTGEYLAYASKGATLRMWKVQQNHEVDSIQAHSAEVWCSTFSPNGRLFVTTSDDHQVKLWDTDSNELKSTLSGHESLVVRALFSPNGDKLVTADFEGVIHVWDVKTAGLLHTLTDHQGPVRSIAIRSNDGVLASAGDDRTVRLWDLDTGKRLHSLPGHENKVRSVVFLPSDGRLASADNSGFIYIWAKDGQLERRWRAAEEIQSLAASANGTVLAAGSKLGNILIYQLPSGELVRQISGKPYSALSLAISPDARTLVTGGEDAAVTLWHLDTGQELFALPGVRAQVNSLAFSQDGQVLTAALHDGTVKFWHAPNSKEKAYHK
ncbi:MAG: protein kinase [Planctomycetales bacterium]|nr:protein kinase [Planctomycetales bacterium]